MYIEFIFSKVQRIVTSDTAPAVGGMLRATHFSPQFKRPPNLPKSAQTPGNLIEPSHKVSSSHFLPHFPSIPCIASSRSICSYVTKATCNSGSLLSRKYPLPKFSEIHLFH